MNRCSPNANVTHGVLLWADFLHQHKSFGKQLSLEELVAFLLGHWGSAQPELTPALVARLKHFAQTLLKWLKPASPLCASPSWRGGNFSKSLGNEALAIQILLEELKKYIGLTMYTVKEIYKSLASISSSI